MRKLYLTLLLCIIILPLSGCAQSEQVENQAYVLILGADTAPEGVEVSVQVLKASGADDGSGSGGDGGKSYLIAAARGSSYSDAMQSLQTLMQRRLNLNQTILVVSSERLARSDMFFPVLRDMFESYLLDTSAWFAVCQGSAADFVASQKPVIGNRVSIAITSMLENYADLGLVPDSTLADVYYSMTSDFSDPTAIYAAVHPAVQKDDGQSSETGLSYGTVLPVSSTGGPNAPDLVPGSSESETVYLGAMLFRDGKAVDPLTVDEVLCLNLIRGGLRNFVVTVDDNAAFLSLSGSPHISVDTSGSAPVIDVRIRLTMENHSALPQPENVEKMLSEQMERLHAHCRTLNAEPFGYAARAAMRFTTLRDWNRYDWHAQFSRAKAAYTLTIQLIDA